MDPLVVDTTRTHRDPRAPLSVQRDQLLAAATGCGPPAATGARRTFRRRSGRLLCLLDCVHVGTRSEEEIDHAAALKSWPAFANKGEQRLRSATVRRRLPRGRRRPWLPFPAQARRWARLFQT